MNEVIYFLSFCSPLQPSSLLPSHIPSLLTSSVAQLGGAHLKISFTEGLTLPNRFSNWAFFSHKQRANLIQYFQFVFLTCLPNLVYISTGDSLINLQMTIRANTW